MNKAVDRQLAKYLADHLDMVRRQKGQQAYLYELRALDEETQRQVVQVGERKVNARLFWAGFVVDLMLYGTMAAGTFITVMMLWPQ